MKIRDLKKNLDEALHAYQKIAGLPKTTLGAERAAADQVKKARGELAAALAPGALPCPKCGALPVGVLQEIDVKKQKMFAVEIGCVNCRHHRALGFSPELAADAWNTGVQSYKGIMVQSDGTVSGVPETWVPRTSDVKGFP